MAGTAAAVAAAAERHLDARDSEHSHDRSKDPAVEAQATTTIARGRETVFAFLVDDFFDTYPRWSPQVVELEPLDADTLATGHRIRQVRVDHGRRSETIVRVTELERPCRLTLASEHAPWFRIGFHLEPDPDPGSAGTPRTHLEFRFDLVRLEMYMRPFGRLIQRAIRQGAEQCVADLRALVERER